MAQLNNVRQAYDTSGSPFTVFPVPILIARAPLATDNAEIGSLLINTAANTAYVCTENELNNAVWQEVSQGAGGPGVFSTLTATGATNLNVATANVFNVLTGASSGAVHINDGTGTGTIGIGNTAAGAVAITSGAASNFTVDGAGIDLSLVSNAGRVVVNGEEAAADAIRLLSVAGGLDSDTALGVNITDAGGAGVDISLISTAGSINLNAGEAIADAINIDSTGGFDLDAALQVNLTSSQAAAADSVRIFASAADGGIDVDAGTGGITIDSTGVLSLDSAGATNLTATGAFDITVNSTLGSVILNAEEAAADAIQIQTVAGGIDVNSALGIDILDVGGAGVDINIASTSGSVNLTSGEAQANAITLSATNAAGGITLDAGATPGITFTNGTQTAQILVGTGSPNTAVTAAQGSIFLNVAGTADTILYVNTDGATAWTALTST